MQYYVITTLTLKYGNLPRLTEAMHDLLPYMKSRGWNLQGAFHPLIGNFSKITHLWAIDDLESVHAMLGGITSDPHILSTITAFTGFVQEEELQLVTKTPYSP